MCSDSDRSPTFHESLSTTIPPKIDFVRLMAVKSQIRERCSPQLQWSPCGPRVAPEPARWSLNQNLLKSPDLQEESFLFLPFLMCLQYTAVINLSLGKKQISKQITNSIISNQIHAEAERLSDHLLTSSNTKPNDLIFAEANCRKIRFAIVPGRWNFLMIDWTFLWADLCSPVCRLLIHLPVVHHHLLSVEAAKTRHQLSAPALTSNKPQRRSSRDVASPPAQSP